MTAICVLSKADGHRRQANEPKHAQLKRRLQSLRGLQTNRIAQVVIAGYAFVQHGCLKTGATDDERTSGRITHKVCELPLNSRNHGMHAAISR